MAKELRQYPVLEVHPREQKFVPWGMLAPHEKRALRNHGQTLEELAQRGGLGWGEILAILEDRPWSSISLGEAKNEEAVMRYVSAYMEGTGNGDS